jgi:hypothetical protein
MARRWARSSYRGSRSGSGNRVTAAGGDLVLSRILRLDGLDPENANTMDRFIYFHGTNQEHLIGQPVSHGCIRLRNDDMILLFDLVEVDDEVIIEEN